jgi:predicted ATPase/DNA-binding SARP family transcriptional activator/tetratricopeptide (TPR) repeat protein
MSVSFQVIAARTAREHHDAGKRRFRGGGNPVGRAREEGGSVEYGLLGPVQAVRAGRPLALGGPRQRAVLARLLLARGRAVPAGMLADDVWGGSPPPSAAKTLQKYVSELRQVLGPEELRTVGGGYQVDGDVDTLRFERLLAAGDAGRALALWRGEPLDGLPDVPFVGEERARLEELRLVAVERAAEEGVQAGRHAEVVAGLAELAAAHPGREHLTFLLMLALYRSGRQVEALEAFARHRRRLAEELGIAPADELTALERSILRHDDDLGARPRAAVPGNVRLPVSTFVGRDDEVRRTVEALRGAAPVTLTGPGGVGKTRLALQSAVAAAADFPGGAWLVDLAGVADPALVVHQVALTLSVGDPRDGDEEGTVLAALAHSDPVLLVLDNCEHLLARCAELVDRVARGCPGARVLATSRQPLGVDGEDVLVVTPLAEPDACRLFEDRVRRNGVEDDDVARLPVPDICRALDGLPLALELAAGQVRALGPAELTAGLDARLRFANRRFDAPARQRTLRDMVAWSHALLSEPTRRVFARLGVFASTMTPAAAEAVCAPDDAAPHLATLVDHSLLVRDPGPGPVTRYRLLDTLRLFALEQLAEAGGEADARAAHARYYRDLLVSASLVLHGPDQEAWIDRIESEEPNVHGALDWAAEHDPGLAVALAVALWPYWDLRWRERFAIAYLTRLLDRHGAAMPPGERAWALTVMADLAANPGEVRLARRPAEQAVGLFRELGDERGLCSALLALACAHRDEGALDAAERFLAEGREIAERHADAFLLVKSVNVAWAIASRRGSLPTAERLAREELAGWVALRSRRGQATALRHLAVTLQQGGDLDGATELCEQALAVWEELGERPALAHAQTTLADISRARGDRDRAAVMYERALGELCAVGDRRCTASTFKNLAIIASSHGEHDRCATLFRDAIRLRCELGDYAGLAECFTGLADDLALRDRHDEAAVLLAAAEERRRISGVTASPEEVRAAERVEARRRAAGVPALRVSADGPTLEEVLGLELWL